ncbi:MAG: NUDIX hydrolase [Acidobacteria bacterium]|nr:NUDIX hydrolase [Acidobacteriota bacterium]
MSLLPASTVVLVREAPLRDAAIEVFLVRRPERGAFSGAHVFPGGRVDDGDASAEVAARCDRTADAAARFPDLEPSTAIAYHVAGIRELFEEAGVLLARDSGGGVVRLSGEAARRYAEYRDSVHAGHTTLAAVLEREGLQLALDALVGFAHWVTPDSEARRFDTRFFLALLPETQSPAHEPVESIESCWLTPAGALDRHARGEICLPPPTWRVLKDTTRLRSVVEAIGWARARRVVRVQPQYYRDEELEALLLPGDPLYPAPADYAFEGETRFIREGNVWRAAGRV